VILSSDEAPLLEHALPLALAEGFDAGLVIDNAGRDATGAVAERHGVPRLSLDRRLPYTEAMNRGLRGLDVDAVALLQADTFVMPGYLAACLKELDDPLVGSVAPKLLRALGPAPRERLALIDAAAMSFDRRRKNSLVGHGAPATAFTAGAEVFGADGAAALWRTAALRECAVDGAFLDENMPGWGCDADLAWRAQLFGWRCRYAPAAVVHHVRSYSPTTRARATPEDRRTQFRNRLLMIAKNDSFADLRPDLLPLFVYELLALGYAVLREHELLGGYREALRRLPEARRQRRQIQARRRPGRVPFGLVPPR
jgi:GT2 family glycosyltransferase